jgi:hypothetical protein
MPVDVEVGNRKINGHFLEKIGDTIYTALYFLLFVSAVSLREL